MRLDFIPVADGAILHAQVGPARALTVASDDDWAECLVAARLALSRGSKAIPEGATWEEALAQVAAWYLRCGVGMRAMGRTADVRLWRAQEKRWTELVHEEAAKGPVARMRMFQAVNVKSPRILSREDAEAALEDAPELELAPVWVDDPDPTVLGHAGRVPFGLVARTKRGA